MSMGKTLNPLLMTEKLLTGMKESTLTKKQQTILFI